MNPDRLVRAIVHLPEEWVELLTGSPRVARWVARGTDVFRVLGDPTSAVRTALRARLGDAVVDALRRVHTENQVTPDAARFYVELLAGQARVGGRLVGAFGTYDDLLRLRTEAGISRLGRMLEADHLVEVRIDAMIAGGASYSTARSLGFAAASRAAQDAVYGELLVDPVARMRALFPERVAEGAAFLVPRSEVVAYRLTRASPGGLRVPLWYPHGGSGGKTARMRAFIPDGLEGTYSYRELLDAVIWVTHHELRLPAELRPIIQEQFIDAIAHSVRQDAVTADFVLPWLQRQLGLRASHVRGLAAGADEPLLDALRRALPIEDLPADFPSRWRWIPPLYNPHWLPPPGSRDLMDEVLDSLLHEH